MALYNKILVALENSRADETVVPHVTRLAREMGAELVLLHVADGWAARNFDQLKLAESAEMKADRDYLTATAEGLRNSGLSVNVQLALGNPPTEILRAAEAQRCDLIVMTSHGHKWLADLFLGSTIDKVRHNTAIPILVVRAGSAA